MPLSVMFDSGHAKDLLRTLSAGASPGEITADELPMLAAAALYLIRHPVGQPPAPESDEESDAAFWDALNAVCLCYEYIRKVEDGTYDRVYKPRIVADLTAAGPPWNFIAGVHGVRPS